MKISFHYPSRVFVIRLFVIMCCSGYSNSVLARLHNAHRTANALQISQEQDSIVDPETDKKEFKTKVREKWVEPKRNNNLDVANATRSPFISIQQLLKGRVSGVYVLENNGEPGTIQSMQIRGVTAPIFTNKDISGVQPAVYVNGIPVIVDNPFVYDIQQSNINPIGTATNIMAGLDMNNIESLEVITDPLKLAKLGPLASKGAIWIVTKDGYRGGSHVTFNSSIGMVAPPSTIHMTNASYENAFRQKFYTAYNVPFGNLPSYLQDHTDSKYFGAPNWADTYYRYAPQYNINATIGGGGTTANYLFTVGRSTNAGVADKTSFGKYNLGFYLNMVPVDGLTMSCMINSGKVNRDRNRNFRDRYAEIEYLPDLSTPISPSGAGYSDFLSKNELTVDDNSNNILNGGLGLNFKKNSFHSDAKLLLDYNTNVRHVFWPSTLMESVSFVSDYSGYNRRLIGAGNVGYNWNINKNHQLDLQLNGSVQADIHHYIYNRAYDGDDDKKTTTSGGSYTLYRYLDKEQSNLASSSVSFDYSYKKLFDLGAVLRYDGSSMVQSDNRWLFTPAVSASWNMKNHFLKSSNAISDLEVTASWARMGRLPESDRFSLGPQYTAEDLNWNGQSVISSYYGFASITRSYSNGWIGYDMGWPYADKLNLELKTSLFKNRLDLSVSYYNNDEKELITKIPVAREYGYQYEYKNGMQINNKGFDFRLSAALLSNPSGLTWNVVVNMSYNWNKLTKLPDGLTELVINDRKLEVGRSVDQFWVYKNQGIYQSEEEVPKVNGTPLSINGISFKKGDPKWSDENGDNVINDKDKVLTGHSLPPFTGGLESQFKYKGFDLAFNFFFALGHSALNSRSQQRYDFSTLDTENSLQAVKEIYFWQNTYNNDDYPIYNPLSSVHPYRLGQDLFLESLSYLKLRTVTLGYTLPTKKKGKKSKSGVDDVYFYMSANNLFTLTDFSGEDPELVDFDGYYRGYSQSIPRSVTFGVKLKF